MFVSVAITSYSIALNAANERISCITRHDNFSPRSHRSISLQVAPFLIDCQGRGDRRRSGQTENEWVYSHLIQNTISNRDFNGEKIISLSLRSSVWIFRLHQLSHSTWIRNHPITFVFLYLFRCSAVIYSIYKWSISVIKIRWKLQLVGFSDDKKSANVVMWKDKEYEYILSERNKQL